MTKIICSRFYRNGSYKAFFADTLDEVQTWVDLNSVHRYGCALVAEGKVKYFGYYGKEEAEALLLKANEIASTHVPYHVEIDNPLGFVRSKLKHALPPGTPFFS